MNYRRKTHPIRCFRSRRSSCHKGTPRLKTAQDMYITANRSFVLPINEA
ncbi:DUF5776 domain-containing protein [Exiguobacterium acetylicum]